ncbi:MAG: NAD(P)H-dependent oxidoreductase [Elainellaceae cyanobacterium]
MAPYRILILFAHPALEKSRINRQLIDAVDDLDAVTIHDLYEAYPQFHIDVAREQQLLLDHDVIVFQHPFYWYNSPALLKEWQDLVLEYGFAFGHDGTALQGKKCFSAITTGGTKAAYCRQGYNYYSIRELLTPFEQTARLCGMEYLPPFVVYGTHQLQEMSQIAPHADRYRSFITTLRDRKIDWEELASNYAIDQDVCQNGLQLSTSGGATSENTASEVTHA